MAIKIYECNICQEQFVLENDTDKAKMRYEVYRHCMSHFTQGCDPRDCFVKATNYRADYVCTQCGGVFREGSKNDLPKRMFEHAQVCQATILPAEFLSDEEIEVLAR
jgi:DNA-directed RNA polymerase subunit RPC12/RpoP